MSEPLSGITYKLVILLKAREGVSLDTFADAWLALEARASIVGDGLVRAVFARPLSGPSPIANASTAPYDAALETWWQREDDAFGWASSRDFEQRWLPQRLALLAGPPAAIGGQPQMIWAREQPAGLAPVTVLVLPVARRNMGFPAFVEHWTGLHARLALGDPHAEERLVRLEDTPSAAVPPAFRKTRYDGVGALTFASLQALAASFTSDYYHEHLAPDEQRFTEPLFSVAFLTQGIELR